MALNQTFRVPVRELLEPFYTERVGPQDLARFTRRLTVGKMMPWFSLGLIVIMTAYELMTGLNLAMHLLLLAAAMGIAFMGTWVSGWGQRKILDAVERQCDAKLYGALMYENAVRMQRLSLPKKSVREQICGIYVSNFAVALCYMGRWEEARELVSRLMRCEPTPIEELNCCSVMARYHYHHMEPEALREAVQDMRCAANGLKPKQTGLLLQNAERMEQIGRAFKEGGAEGAYQACLELKPVKNTPLARVQRAFELGRMELELGLTEKAESHLAYAAGHGKDLFAAREASRLLGQNRREDGAAGDASPATPSPATPAADDTDRERGI